MNLEKPIFFNENGLFFAQILDRPGFSCYPGNMKTFKLLALAFLVCTAKTSFAVDLPQIERDLSGSGVTGWIHAAVPGQGLYVFTYRNPADFFDHIEMSLVAFQPEIQSQLATFNRQDKVTLHGSFLDNPSPQKHILVTSIEMAKKFEPSYPSEPYQHEAKLPDDLINVKSAQFLVHAVAGDGHILVTEYKDSIVPVFVEKNELTKNLYRGDLVQLAIKIQSYPGRPVHLNLDTAVPESVKVLETIHAKHGKLASVEGALIMFQKSPEILFNVFAVQEKLPAGLSRQYTIVNMENPDLFAKIRTKLQQAWDQESKAYVNGRNKLVSTHVKVKVVGIFNEVDPGQANAQILVPSLDSISVSSF